MESRYSLPIGTDDFRKLREVKSHYYVDKTLLIQEILNHRMEGLLFTRPRRFGKTLNMTMIRDYFDLHQDSKSIFEGLAILETQYAKQLNSRPVLYFSFKNCESATANGMLWKLMREIHKEYARYARMYAKTLTCPEHSFIGFIRIHSYFLSLLSVPADYEGNLPSINVETMMESLSELIQTVHLLTGIKPMVLIDEYDQPLLSAHKAGYRESFSPIYAGFLTEGLKGNVHLQQSILTGIQRVAKESIFSKLNNIVAYTVSDERYGEFFGLTEDETNKALIAFGMVLTEEVKTYYDGYRFGRFEIYNPWSVLNYIDKLKLEPYWVHTSTNALIHEAIKKADSEFFESFEELIAKSEAVVSVDLQASFIELESSATLWGLLVNSGYLTIIGEYGASLKLLKIPNEESRTEFRKIVAAYTKINEQSLDTLFASLARNDMDRFLKLYKKIVNQCTSYYDAKENAYHMLFLGMSMAVSSLYDIKSNIESGDGRPDILMVSKQPALRPHMVIEFKQSEDLESAKTEALDQIIKKNYFVNLTGEVLCLGIAHHKKACDLSSRLLRM
ncbi:MAG: ATP-binding protein [Turicibacter sp.]|nr:ATP-binding protein [Turicibacter sp.]